MTHASEAFKAAEHMLAIAKDVPLDLQRTDEWWTDAALTNIVVPYLTQMANVHLQTLQSVVQQDNYGGYTYAETESAARFLQGLIVAIEASKEWRG